MTYKLKLDIFEGPLDLLLYLIKKDDIDIADIPIAQITDQYLQYIEVMKMLDLDIVGDFLVMAATLMHIKSKMLLPSDPAGEEDNEEDPRDELVRRLLDYKRIKQAADQLQERESLRQDLFRRMIDEERLKEIKEDAREVMFEATLFDLISAFTAALNRLGDKQIYEVTSEEFTVEDKIHDILHLLVESDNIMLSELFARARSKIEMIVTFLAVLELIRLKEISITQTSLFGDIMVKHNKEKEKPQNENHHG
jgi:segregation and condensation protein A